MTIKALVACTALLAIAGFDIAEAAPRARETTTINGCARSAVPFCTTVSYRGSTYVLHGFNPTIPPRTKVSVTGRVTGEIGICPGKQMQVTGWRKARGRCAP